MRARGFSPAIPLVLLAGLLAAGYVAFVLVATREPLIAFIIGAALAWLFHSTLAVILLIEVAALVGNYT